MISVSEKVNNEYVPRCSTVIHHETGACGRTCVRKLIDQDKISSEDEHECKRKLFSTWKSSSIDFNCVPREKCKRPKSLPQNLDRLANSDLTFIDSSKPCVKDLIIDEDLPIFNFSPNSAEDQFRGDDRCSKELEIGEQTHSDKDTNSYDLDDILDDNFEINKHKSRFALAFSHQSDSLYEAELAQSREDNHNKKNLKFIMKNNKVQRKNDYYEIELKNAQQNSRNSLSYVFAVGMTVGAVGFYVASQTVRKGLGLLTYIN